MVHGNVKLLGLGPTHVTRCTYLNIELNLKILEIVTLDKKCRARTPHSLKFHMGTAISSQVAPKPSRPTYILAPLPARPTTDSPQNPVAPVL